LQKNTQLKLISYSLKDNRYLLLKQYKDMLLASSHNFSYRSEISRTGKLQPGPFLVEYRRILYQKLMELQQETGWKLISEAEIDLTMDFWDREKDIHNKPSMYLPRLF
jgi:hypothetical protein